MKNKDPLRGDLKACGKEIPDLYPNFNDKILHGFTRSKER
jgi:hypothetical protein